MPVAEIFCFSETASRDAQEKLTIEKVLAAIFTHDQEWRGTVCLSFRIRFAYEEQGPQIIRVNMKDEQGALSFDENYPFNATSEGSILCYAVSVLSLPVILKCPQMYTAALLIGNTLLQETHLRVTAES